MLECMLAALLSLAASPETACDVPPSAAPGTAVPEGEWGSALPRPMPGVLGTEEPEADAGGDAGGPSALRNQAMVYGVTVLYAAAYADVRKRILDRGSLSNIARNFRDPIGRAVEGARRDNDPFKTNYVAHPVSWGLVGYYFRSRGHSFWSSLAMSQGHSVFWEYVVEGSYAMPSGTDLITNFLGATAGIVLAGWLEGSPSTLDIRVTPGPTGAAARFPGDPHPAGMDVRVRLFH